MEPEILEEQRQLLHQLLHLLPRHLRHPVASIQAVGSRAEAEGGSAATWTYFPHPGGGFGIGSIPERVFLEEARLPDRAAVMEWVWTRIATEFIRVHVLPTTGSRHGVDSLLLSILCPRDEKAAVLMAADATTVDLATPARSSSAWVRAAVACRTDADPVDLAEIADRAATTLLGGRRILPERPIDPDSPDAIALRNVLTNPVTPPSTLDRFTTPQPHSRRWVTQAATSNPSTPGGALTRLALHDDPAIRWTVAGNSSAPPPAVDHLLDDADLVSRWFLARHHSVPPGEFAVWMREEPQVVRCAAQGVNVGTVAASGDDVEPEVRLTVAQNRAAPPDVLEAWARGSDDAASDDRIAAALAANPTTPVDACRRLIERNAAAVAVEVLRRSDVTDELIDLVLATDRSWARRVPPTWARLLLLQPSPLPPRVAARLVRVDDATVREFVARSGNLEGPAVQGLVSDGVATVRLRSPGIRQSPSSRSADSSTIPTREWRPRRARAREADGRGKRGRAHGDSSRFT